VTPKITVLRIIQRWALAATFTLTLFGIVWLVITLTGTDPNAALMTLVGGALVYVGKSLENVTAAIAVNPSDRADRNEAREAVETEPTGPASLG
jgi:hypothetical protein